MHMIIQKLLNWVGKDYAIDQTIPSFELLRICFTRVLWLIWGFIRMQRSVFISPTATIQSGYNLKIGKASTLEPYCLINASASQPVMIGERVKIGAYSRIVATAHLSKLGRGITIGSDSGCGEFCYFGAVGGITIGRNVIMGQYVSFHSQDHLYANTQTPIKHQGTMERGIIVGEDCWIGTKATILDGTFIGKHCVIAAGAVVKAQFPDHSIIGGVPARTLRDIADAA